MRAACWPTLKEREDAMAASSAWNRCADIGMVSTAKYFVPQLLALFHAEHPGVDVRLRVVGNREAAGHDDAGRRGGLSVMGRPHPRLATRAEPLRRTRWCSWRRRAIPCGRTAGHARGGAGRRYPFIVREHGSGTRNAMERILAAHRFEPRI
jgi:DNA-binding transcriptional LysR family regulator